jgi:hypothetical protein
MQSKFIRQLNRFVLGTYRKDRGYINPIRLNTYRYILLEAYLIKHNLNFFGEDVVFRHKDGSWGRKFMGIDIKVRKDI